MTTPQLRVELEVQPAQITMAKRKDALVRMTVTNLGTTTKDFELGLSELKVDGEVSKAWSMSLNNSGHPKTWRALPPGERVSQAAALGEELFAKPGDYTVELIVAGVAATPVRVRVTQ